MKALVKRRASTRSVAKRDPRREIAINDVLIWMHSTWQEQLMASSTPTVKKYVRPRSTGNPPRDRIRHRLRILMHEKKMAEYWLTQSFVSLDQKRMVRARLRDFESEIKQLLETLRRSRRAGD